MIPLPIFPPLYADWALFLLRIVLGLILLYHGTPKFKNLKETGKNFHAMGFKPGMFWGPLVACVETFGALFLIAGFLTQLVAAVIVIQFLVIHIWKLKMGKKFADAEVDLLILASAVVLLSIGSGGIGIDGAFTGMLSPLTP